MPHADNYLVEWVRYNAKEDECCTHARHHESDRAACGVTTTDGAGCTLTQAGGIIGCRRCQKLLESRGVLPLAVIETSDFRGNLIYVAAQA